MTVKTQGQGGSPRWQLSGNLRVALPPAEAIRLFTPEGERLWISHWNPWFPALDGEAGSESGLDDTEPGTVFATDDTIWVVIAREPGRRMAYARITPEDRAGTVTVTLEADGPDGLGSIVTVAYDLTALTPDARDRLHEFAGQFPAMLRDWERWIATYIATKEFGT